MLSNTGVCKKKKEKKRTKKKEKKRIFISVRWTGTVKDMIFQY